MENNRINRKDQQSAGGNWGHPRPFTKKHTNIPDRTEEVGKRQADKKYKEKIKVNWLSKYYACPFCSVELPVVCQNPHKLRWPSEIRAKKCRNCGARQRKKSCPSCKGDTFYKDEIYMHQRHGCGFIGKKKVILG